MQNPKTSVPKFHAVSQRSLIMDYVDDYDDDVDDDVDDDEDYDTNYYSNYQHFLYSISLCLVLLVDIRTSHDRSNADVNGYSLL